MEPKQITVGMGMPRKIIGFITSEYCDVHGQLIAEITVTTGDGRLKPGDTTQVCMGWVDAPERDSGSYTWPYF